MTLRAAACMNHCDHVVGVLRKNSHGPFAPPRRNDERAKPAFRCCHCGRYDTGGTPLTDGDILFDAGCGPTEGLT